MKLTFTLLTFFFTLTLFGQDILYTEWKPVLKDTNEIKLILDKLRTKDSLNVLLQLTNSELVTYNQDHPLNSDELKELERLEYLTTNEDDGLYVYCLINIETSSEYRASYIYLDGTKLDKTEIDSIQSIIIKKLKTGAQFEDLHEKYNMDPNTNGGDLGWFVDGQMMPEFEKAVREHKINEIFTVDIPSKDWYYVTLKTFKNRTITSRSYLKIRSSS